MNSNNWQSVEDTDHYRPSVYLNPARMASIGHQINLMAKHFPNSSIMEIGVGNGLATQLLREDGHAVTTFDIDRRLNPDIEGSIVDNDLSDGQFDAILCCQVLEHLPWEEVPKALAQIHRIVGSGAVISVPTVQRVTGFFYFSAKRNGKRQFQVPFLSKTGQPMRVKGDSHYWELGANKTDKEFEALIVGAGFRIVEQIRPIGNLYHQFYVLKK